MAFYITEIDDPKEKRNLLSSGIQDYRDFDFNSPWGAETSIKDEKNND